MKQIQLLALIINETHVDFSYAITNLGCQIIESLDWSKQVSQISSRVHGALYRLRFHRQSLSRELKQRLVESLVLPHFDYACAVYHNFTTKSEATSPTQFVRTVCIWFYTMEDSDYSVQTFFKLAYSRKQAYFPANFTGFLYPCQ